MSICGSGDELLAAVISTAYHTSALPVEFSAFSFLLSCTDFAWMSIPQNRLTIHVKESSSAYIHHPLLVPIHSCSVHLPTSPASINLPISSNLSNPRTCKYLQVYPPARPSHAIKKLKREPICTLEDATDQLSTNRPGPKVKIGR
jgi:hypothetical protein